jgi:hypothetical protein
MTQHHALNLLTKHPQWALQGGQWQVGKPRPRRISRRRHRGHLYCELTTGTWPPGRAYSATDRQITTPQRRKEPCTGNPPSANTRLTSNPVHTPPPHQHCHSVLGPLIIRSRYLLRFCTPRGRGRLSPSLPRSDPAVRRNRHKLRLRPTRQGRLKAPPIAAAFRAAPHTPGSLVPRLIAAACSPRIRRRPLVAAISRWESALGGGGGGGSRIASRVQIQRFQVYRVSLRHQAGTVRTQRVRTTAGNLNEAGAAAAGAGAASGAAARNSLSGRQGLRDA